CKAKKRRAAAQPPAVQGELERALPVAGARVAVRLPPAAVPDHDAAGPVVPFRDHALEPSLLYRMIRDVHRQPLLAWHRLRLLGNGPALEHPVQLQTEIIVQAGGRVALDDEGQAAGGASPAAPRLRRGREVPHAAVGRQSHGSGGLLPARPVVLLALAARSRLGEALLKQIRDIDDLGAPRATRLGLLRLR